MIRRPQPPSKALPCTSSNTIKPSGDSCCCRGAGWWNDRLPGRRGFGGWPAITNDFPPPWPDTTGWLSLLSCSVLYFAKVKYRLYGIHHLLTIDHVRDELERLAQNFRGQIKNRREIRRH